MFYAAHALSMMVGLLYKHLDMHEKKLAWICPLFIKTNIGLYISPVGGHHFKKILLHLPSAAPLITKFNFEKNVIFLIKKMNFTLTGLIAKAVLCYWL